MANATARIQSKKQTLDDAYAPPANFLEIDVVNAETHGVGKKRYTDYEVRMKVWFVWLETVIKDLELLLFSYEGQYQAKYSVPGLSIGK